MKSKTITAIISFLAGSTGAHRFYLGQNRLGWFFLVFFYVLFAAAIWYSKIYHVANHYMLTTIWIVLICITHIVEAIRYGVMREEKFETENKSTGATLPLTVTSIIFAIAANYGFNYLTKTTGTINIETANTVYEISSVELSTAYNNDEKLYMEKYHGRVLEVSGRVQSFGEDFEKGTYLTLQPADGSPADVNCYINNEYLKELSEVATGDSIIIKGVCNRRFLDNCKIITVVK